MFGVIAEDIFQKRGLCMVGKCVFVLYTIIHTAFKLMRTFVPAIFIPTEKRATEYILQKHGHNVFLKCAL